LEEYSDILYEISDFLLPPEKKFKNVYLRKNLTLPHTNEICFCLKKMIDEKLIATQKSNCLKSACLRTKSRVKFISK